jgi:hypothetical protein
VFLDLATLTIVHVLISLAGIGSGLIVLYGLLTAKRMEGWNLIFLTTTIATSVSGFLFPFFTLLPSHIVGVISLILLAVAVWARYPKRLAGTAGPIYAATAVLALYLNVFVLVVQLFLKIPSINALAPTQSEPPFAVTQGLVFLAFALLGYKAAVKQRPSRRLAQAA